MSGLITHVHNEHNIMLANGEYLNRIYTRWLLNIVLSCFTKLLPLVIFLFTIFLRTIRIISDVNRLYCKIIPPHLADRIENKFKNGLYEPVKTMFNYEDDLK